MGVCCSTSDKQHNDQETLRKNSQRKRPPERVNSTSEFIPSVVNKNCNSIDQIYQIADKALGAGAFGEVRLATHKTTLIKRAVKIIFKQHYDPQ